MTNREDLPETVAVPVELLKELIEIVSFHKGSTPAGRQATALLPKPKPRLVAVNVEDLPVGGGVTHWNAWAHNLRDDAPDLLTLLDEAADSVFSDWSGYNFDIDVVVELKSRIRAALGVYE